MLKEKSNILEVKHLYKTYETRMFSGKVQETNAVNDVSFAIKKGETFALIGESGSGKTTIAMLLMHLVKPTSGKIFYDGEDVVKIKNDRLRLFRKRIQMVFQNPQSALDPRFTIGRSLEEGLIIQGKHNAIQRKELIYNYMEKCGIESSCINRYPYELSGGQLQRVCIARTLLLEPDFIILDEPISALDISVQVQIIDLLVKIRAELGVTILLISHNPGFVRFFSMNVAVMFRGYIVEMSTCDELFENPLHHYTRYLLSPLSSSNLLSADNFLTQEQVSQNNITSISGCPFCGICRRPMFQCKNIMPDLVNVGNNQLQHYVRCFQ